jgi:benzyl alcohol O-benzoyltransferase
MLQQRILGMPQPTCMDAVLDITRANKFDNLDFGWGKPVYGGPTEATGTPMLPCFSSFFLPLKNAKGEHGIAVPIMYLPTHTMDRVVEEMG